MAKFSLPASSLAELNKIILAYANSKPDASLRDVSLTAGMAHTKVSGNNKFLAGISIISGGNVKSITELGKALGRAIEHEQSADVADGWVKAISSNEPLASILTTVRIKGGMPEAELVKQILYAADQSNSAANRTGARCIVDVFASAGMLDEKDGIYTVSKSEKKQQSESSAENIPLTEEVPLTPERRVEVVQLDRSKTEFGSQPNVTINIELQIPEATDPDTYDSLFKALRENLFPGK